MTLEMHDIEAREVTEAGNIELDDTADVVGIVECREFVPIWSHMYGDPVLPVGEVRTALFVERHAP